MTWKKMQNGTCLFLTVTNAYFTKRYSEKNWDVTNILINAFILRWFSKKGNEIT